MGRGDGWVEGRIFVAAAAPRLLALRNLSVKYFVKGDLKYKAGLVVAAREGQGWVSRGVGGSR